MNDDSARARGSEIDETELDELLSADIDGELDAAARDLGITIDDARARIRTHPYADSRRGELVAARDELARPLEIDELIAQRLRAKAVRAADAEHRERAADRRQRRRMLAGAGTVAATILVVAAVAVGLNARHGGSYSASSKSASAPVFAPARVSSTTAAPKHAPGSPVALGSFADVRTLGEAAVVQAATVPLNAPGAVSAPGATSNAPTAAAPEFASQKASQNAALTCTTAPPGPGGDQLVLHATAVLASKPVIVLVFARPGEHVVVIDQPNCALVNLQTLR